MNYLLHYDYIALSGQKSSTVRDHEIFCTVKNRKENPLSRRRTFPKAYFTAVWCSELILSLVFLRLLSISKIYAQVTFSTLYYRVRQSNWRGNALETCLCGDVSHRDIRHMFCSLFLVGISFKELHEWKSRLQNKNSVFCLLSALSTPSIKLTGKCLMQQETFIDTELSFEFLWLKMSI